MESMIWVNGVRDGGVPGDDLGLTRGLSVFETLRTYGTAPFGLEPHLDRLYASAETMDIALRPRAEVRQVLLDACRENVWIRYTVTAGGNWILQTAPIETARIGGPVTVASLRWNPPPELPGAVKHGSRAAWVLAARRRQVDEVLLVSPKGEILEANRSNVVAVVDGVLRTPPLDGRQLSGVTRSALLEAAATHGLTLEEGPIKIDDDFDELYLTSTLKEMAPVVAMDGRPGPGGGPIGAALHAAFRTHVQAQIHRR